MFNYINCFINVLIGKDWNFRFCFVFLEGYNVFVFLFWVFLGLDILKYNELVYFVEVYGYGYIECFI